MAVQGELVTKMYNHKECLDALLKADSEAEVIDILTRAGYWNDESVWRNYGDHSENWATAGNQQSRPDHALVEKLTNAIDTKLIAAAKVKRIPIEGPNAPQSIYAARDLLFAKELDDIDHLSRSITVAATGARRRPSITIADDGEGQTPLGMPRTILSLHKGNKGNIPFVQGKFNMGGSGVLEFCGIDYNVELILSRRNPQLLAPDATDEDKKWSFTIIRRENPGPNSPRASRFTFLAPGPADKEGRRSLLTFDAQTMPIFPDKNQAYVREAEWGTLFKMYEYGTRAVTNMMLSDGLMSRIRLLLPEPALPIRFHECRDYKGHSGSFDTSMPGIIYTLEADRKNPKRQNVEWFDKFDIDVDGEKFTARIYLFRKPEKGETGNPADTYRKDEGVIFTFNGQCQASFSKDFFRRARVRQDYLRNSLLIFVDCSSIGVRAHERLFMPNREKLRHTDLEIRLERELEEKLRDHSELEQIAIARRKSELSDNTEVSESFEKFVEEMVKKHPLLEKVLGPGFRIANPFKPHSVESKETEWEGVRFPTKFHFRDQSPGETLSREAYINSDIRIGLVTDAANDYFRRDEQPGTFELFEVHDGILTPAKNWWTPHLFNGVASLKLQLPSNAEIGSVAVYEAHITDPSRVEPFKNRFGLVVRPERAEQPPRPPQPPKPPKPPSETDGKDTQSDTKLNIPNPHEVWERDWASQDPPFDKLTAMRIKRPPGAGEDSSVFDYSINMNNVWLDQAAKESPRRAKEFRDRYKFGMTLLSLALIRHELEAKSKRPKLESESESDDEEKVAAPTDVRDAVAEVTSAISPFLLPLVDTLSQITGAIEPLSASAGETA